MAGKIFKLILALSLTAGVFICPGQKSLALDNAADTAAKLAQQAAWQAELRNLEEQIKQYQNDLNKISGQKNSLQKKLNQLKIQQAKLSLQIKATALKIDDLNASLLDTQLAIMQTEINNTKLKEQLGRVLQLIYQRDNYPFVFILASDFSLSAILAVSSDYNKIIRGLNDLLAQTKIINQELKGQKTILSGQEAEMENLLAIDRLQQQGLKDSAREQVALLTETKGRESNYKNILADTKKQAQEIRGRLYQLLEVSVQITFGQAVEIANWASAQSGVRSAFLLAVISQESNLGKNVGTCNRLGDPPEKSWKIIMHPDRDQPIFPGLTEELGKNTDITPVSCPMRDKNGKQIGWGGAMGPAQFIPSTWAGYKNKITAVTGKPANPWDIRDAFLAAALKLAAGGATAKSGEWAAAVRYFSGSANSKYGFYGDSVTARAEDYQADIDQIKK